MGHGAPPAPLGPELVPSVSPALGGNTPLVLSFCRKSPQKSCFAASCHPALCLLCGAHSTPHIRCPPGAPSLSRRAWVGRGGAEGSRAPPPRFGEVTLWSGGLVLCQHPARDACTIQYRPPRRGSVIVVPMPCG